MTIQSMGWGGYPFKYLHQCMEESDCSAYIYVVQGACRSLSCQRFCAKIGVQPRLQVGRHCTAAGWQG